MKPSVRTLVVPVSGLLILAVTLRLAFSFFLRPGVGPDTESYYALIHDIFTLDFSGYTGFRVPGYTILVLLFTGENQYLVWAIQSVLGVATTFLLFWICLICTGSKELAFLIGILHTLAINQLFFEAHILSETLTTFLVVITTALFIYALKKSRATKYLAAVGIFAALAALTRPLFIYLGPILVVLVLIFDGSKRMAAIIGGTFIVIILGWMLFNKATVGYFGLQTSQGYGILNHTGKFIERASDEYATVRDIYLKYREENIRKTGSQVVTIFLARDELREKTGLSELALSQLLSKLSFELIVNNPSLYIKSVLPAWVDFWRIRDQKGNRLLDPAAREVVIPIWSILRWLLMLVNLLAILAIGFVLARDVSRRAAGRTGLSPSMVVANVVLVASVLQALAEYGAGSRYAVPTQSLGWLLVILVVWDLARDYKGRIAGNVAGQVIRP